MQLRWFPSALTSLVHSAQAVCSGTPLNNSPHTRAFQPLAHRLVDLIPEPRRMSCAVWDALADRTIDRPENEEAEAAVWRAACPTGVQLHAWQSIHNDYVDQVQGHLPELSRELELRIRPIRQQWEARGPGIWRALQQSGVPVPTARSTVDVACVMPVIGGAGHAHLDHGSVRIEAVLADPIAGLPEVVRLAWMMIALTLHDQVNHSPPSRKSRRSIVELASIPICLAACQQVELTCCDPSMIQLAIDHWIRASNADLGLAVWEWWSEGSNWSPGGGGTLPIDRLAHRLATVAR